MSTERFLKQRAVNIAVSGSYALSNWYDPQGKPRSFACRTTRISPFRMIVDVPVVGKLGDPITSYFSDFGRLEGFISDTMARAFLIELEMTRSMRVKLAEKLTWLERKQKDPSVGDARKDARIIPAKLAFDPDPGRRQCPWLLHYRYVGLRSRGLRPGAASRRNAAGSRRLHRPRRQAVARRLCGQVRRKTEPQRSQPAHHPISVTTLGH